MQEVQIQEVEDLKLSKEREYLLAKLLLKRWIDLTPIALVKEIC